MATGRGGKPGAGVAAAGGRDTRPLVKVTPGPRKKRKPGGPGERLSNHKRRAVWFRARAAWPVREAPVARLVRERARARRDLAPAPGTAQWEAMGPTNIGGRVTSAACDPRNPDRIWIGAAGGGVWFSPDAGRSWQAQWHGQEVLNVGSLAIDPANPKVLYCGTGEANLSVDSYAGVGVYKTRDGGRTWKHIARSRPGGLPRRIGAIAVDPFDSRHLVLAGVGYDEMGEKGDLGGVFTSRDGGATWKRETFLTTRNYWAHDVAFHPAKRGTLFITVTERGAGNGIYRSTDGGVKWTQLRKGLPPSDRIGRASLAISPSHPDVIYALASDDRDGVLGVFRSANGGDSWVNRAGRHFREEGQMLYGNTIAVHPRNPDHVLCGGVDLHLSTDGGRSWKQASRWDSRAGRPDYAHADHHGLLMPAAAPGRVYSVNDGGLDLSEDGGRSWDNRSRGLAVTMYYDLDIGQSDERVFGGGAQDNGTLLTVSGGADDHREVLGGDGGWIVVDPADARHFFASHQNMGVYRFRGGAPRDVSPPVTDAEAGKIWMCYICLDPADARTLYLGSTRVWRSGNDGNSWSAASKHLDGSPITAIEVSGADRRRIYVGTENGGFFRSADGGASWSANLAGATLPGLTVTRIDSHPRDADMLYVTVGNFGCSHLYRSRDGGLRWEDVDRGRLPDVPHHAVLMQPDRPQTVYLCNDTGVFVSYDGGGVWKDLSRNLPNCMVVDLVYHEASKRLYAATYGRSIWRLKVA